MCGRSCLVSVVARVALCCVTCGASDVRSLVKDVSRGRAVVGGTVSSSGLGLAAVVFLVFSSRRVRGRRVRSAPLWAAVFGVWRALLDPPLDRTAAPWTHHTWTHRTWTHHTWTHTHTHGLFLLGASLLGASLLCFHAPVWQRRKMARPRSGGRLEFRRVQTVQLGACVRCCWCWCGPDVATSSVWSPCALVARVRCPET